MVQGRPSFTAKFLGDPKKVITEAIKKAAKDAFPEVRDFIKGEIIPALIFGTGSLSNRLLSISNTSFYKWVSSEEGLSQLGIEATEPPKLLEAYQETLKVGRNATTISFNFGDVVQLMLFTPHPASGTGKLTIESWLEWVFDDVTAPEHGFVSRARIRRLPDSDDVERLESFIRLGAPLGGLMLPHGQIGSFGFWEFPETLKDFETDWLAKNLDIVNELMVEKYVDAIERKLK